MLNRRSFLTLGLGAAVAAKFAQLMPAPLESIIVPSADAYTRLAAGVGGMDDLLVPRAIRDEAMRLLHQRLRFGKAYSAPEMQSAMFPYDHCYGVDFRINPDEYDEMPLPVMSERILKPAMSALAERINDDREYRNAVMTFRGLRAPVIYLDDMPTCYRFDVMRLVA